jgi:hypothetical protein
MKRVIKISAIMAGLAVGMVFSLCAEDVVLPYTFSAGETAKAGEVNANFETLKNAVNSKYKALETMVNGKQDKFSSAGVEWLYIDARDINLRGETKEIGHVTLSAPSDGYVVVRFDGRAIASKGDQLVLAASDDLEWDGNDGITTVFGYDDEYNVRNFSHTRIYTVNEGNHIFYAIGENVSHTDGTGKAYIWATLSATFFPNRY